MSKNWLDDQEHPQAFSGAQEGAIVIVLRYPVRINFKTPL
jgi:hypothetical protein